MKLWVGIATVGLTIFVSLVLWWFTHNNPAFTNYSAELLSFSAAMTIVHLGAALLFLLGLKAFTPKLKAAYRLFCTGIVLFAVAELQLPIGTLLGLASSVWFSTWLLVPIMVGIWLVYAGLRRLALLFSVRSIWLSPWFVAAVALVVSAAAYFLPLGSYLKTEQEARGTMALITLSAMIFLAGAVLVYKTWRLATARYAQALQWLFLGQLSLTVGTFVNVIAYVTVGPAHWILLGGYTILIESVLSFSLVKAAYDFSMINETADAPVQPTGSGSLVDVVIAAAAKASSTVAIDPLLDNVRVITAQLAPGQTPTGPDQTILIQTYKNIERYLTEQEPVRRYDRTELRQLLAHDLHLPGLQFFDTIDKA